MIMKSHNFLCKRGIQARNNSLSDYFSRGLRVTQMASTSFGESAELWLTLQTLLAWFPLPDSAGALKLLFVSICIIWSWCLGRCCAGAPSPKAQAAKEQSGQLWHNALPKPVPGSGGAWPVHEASSFCLTAPGNINWNTVTTLPEVICCHEWKNKFIAEG